MASMDSYPKAAMERAMKVQDVMLQAMAKKITWWQAAEILGISDRHMRRWRERYVEEGYNGLFDRRRGAAFSRETAGRARDRTELHLGEASVAGSRVSGARAQAWSASQTARAAAVAGDAVAHRRQPPPMVSGRTLVRPDRDSGRRHQRDLLRAAGGRGIDGDGDGGTAGGDRAQGRVLRSVQRSRQPFLADAEGGRQGGLSPPDPGGTGAARVGGADDSGLLAAGKRQGSRSNPLKLAEASGGRICLQTQIEVLTEHGRHSKYTKDCTGSR